MCNVSSTVDKYTFDLDIFRCVHDDPTLYPLSGIVIVLLQFNVEFLQVIHTQTHNTNSLGLIGIQFTNTFYSPATGMNICVYS